jgi:ATP/ADP translocase
LQVITGIIILTFIVDVTIEYQFNAMAKLAYQSKTQLTAFLGNFYGLWLNLVTFSLQFFLTAAVVRWFGVGGTLQIMPITISLTALATFFALYRLTPAARPAAIAASTSAVGASPSKVRRKRSPTRVAAALTP